MKSRVMTFVFLICLHSQCLADSQIPTLKHNPFTQPPLVDQIQAPANRTTLEPWSGVLQATLVAGDQSMANVSGKLVALNEVIEDHRLVSVGEGVAIFESKGVKVTLKIDDGDIGQSSE